MSLVQHPDPEIGKTQFLRMVDVWVLGPAMIYVGAVGGIPQWMRPLAVLGGAATIVYNYRNYVRLNRYLADG